jgi:hypothetical protein
VRACRVVRVRCVRCAAPYSTTYLGMGSYEEWDEEKRVEFLVRELSGKRPLIPADMPASDVLAPTCPPARGGRIAITDHLSAGAASEGGPGNI